MPMVKENQIFSWQNLWVFLPNSISLNNLNSNINKWEHLAADE